MTDEAERRPESGVLAFEAFYQREYAGLVRLAFTLTGRRDLAEELAQDSFLACLRHWDNVSGYDDPTGWVRRVLTNRCVSSGRRHLTELRLLVKLRGERPRSPSLSEPSDRLWEAVRQLPKRQAQVLALAFVEDLDVRRIAATLGIGQESVRTHLRRDAPPSLQGWRRYGTMADNSFDQIASNARIELRQRLAATPPDIRRLAQRARARRRTLSGVAAVLVIVAIAVPLALRNHDGASQIIAGPPPAGSNTDLLRAGEFRALARAPLAGRSTMAVVWTGHQMLVWGGDGPNGQFADGATYDPRSDAWTLLPDSALSARNAPAAVWTGEEVILWGGSSSSGDHRDGAAYNPATGRWRSIAEAPFASAGRPVGLWTGSEMIVLAGFNSRDAAAYNPATDNWRTLPDLPGQLQAPNPVGVWVNNEAVTVIQSNGSTPAASKRLVSLRPDSNEWSDVSDLPSGQAVLAATGDTLLVATGSESFELLGGDSKEIAVAPAGVAVGDTPSVWTGTELLLWEGDTASAIDPAARTWQSIPAGDSSRRTQPAVVWADGVLLAWGGFPDHAGGVMLRPPEATRGT